jgi:hypothetical protein
MKTHFVCLLILCSHFATAQIVFEPEGTLKKKEKSDADKIRMGLSTQLVTMIYANFHLLCAVNVYHKNKQFAAGPIFNLNHYEPPSNIQIKNYGYNLAFRYIFPQNKGIGKAFIPLEFNHLITLVERTSYYNHQLAPTGSGNPINPGYSFNLNTKSRTHNFAIRTGLGIFVWLHDHFNVQVQATLGPNFSMSAFDYIDSDKGTSIGTENLTSDQSQNKLSGAFSVGFGYRF